MLWALLLLPGLSACGEGETILEPGPRIEGFELRTGLSVEGADRFTVTVRILNRSDESRELVYYCRRHLKIYTNESATDLVGGHPRRCEQQVFTSSFGAGQERVIEMESYEISFSEPIDAGDYYVSAVVRTPDWTVELPVGSVPLESKDRGEQILPRF